MQYKKPLSEAHPTTIACGKQCLTILKSFGQKLATVADKRSLREPSVLNKYFKKY